MILQHPSSLLRVIGADSSVRATSSTGGGLSSEFVASLSLCLGEQGLPQELVAVAQNQGQACSDVAGVLFGGFVETMAQRMGWRTALQDCTSRGVSHCPLKFECANTNFNFPFCAVQLASVSTGLPEPDFTDEEQQLPIVKRVGVAGDHVKSTVLRAQCTTSRKRLADYTLQSSRSYT
eukprot:6464521-Amphidinium_carterae.3